MKKNHVPLPPFRAPNGICKFLPRPNKNNQSEPSSQLLLAKLANSREERLWPGRHVENSRTKTKHRPPAGSTSHFLILQLNSTLQDVSENIWGEK